MVEPSKKSVSIEDVLADDDRIGLDRRRSGQTEDEAPDQPSEDAEPGVEQQDNDPDDGSGDE